MDNLLSTYRELEQSFMISVYELYKAFRFRTLWEGNNPLVNFQRLASESAHGTGQLNGIIQLTDVMRRMEQTETKAVQCFTNNVYATNIKKWSFEKTRDVDVSSRITFRKRGVRTVGDEKYFESFSLGVFVSLDQRGTSNFGKVVVKSPKLSDFQFNFACLAYKCICTFNELFGVPLPAILYRF